MSGVGAVDMLLPAVTAGVTAAGAGVVLAAVAAVGAFGSVIAPLIIPVLAAAMSIILWRLYIWKKYLDCA